MQFCIFGAMSRIMAFDYGMKRIGVAVTDPLKIVANGLKTVTNEDVWFFLEDYLQHEQVELFVVGEPTHLDGSPTYLEKEIQSFIGELNKRYPDINVVRQDEWLTSYEAKQIILQSGVNKKKRRDKGLVDKVSAVLILQNYLEQERN